MTQSPDPKTFAINVAPVQGVRVMGMKIRTSMATAPTDCSKLWHETFGPRMSEVPGHTGVSYGISEMVNCETGIFDYWAAAAANQEATPPAGMEALDLPGGLYAQCRVEGLGEIGAAYQFLYTTWLPGQTEIGPDYTARCYELYPAEFMNNGVFYIYVRVNPK